MNPSDPSDPSYSVTAETTASATTNAAASEELAMPWYTRLGWFTYLLIFIVPGLLAAWSQVRLYAHPENIDAMYVVSKRIFQVCLFAGIFGSTWWITGFVGLPTLRRFARRLAGVARRAIVVLTGGAASGAKGD